MATQTRTNWQPAPSAFPEEFNARQVNLAGTFAIDGFEAGLSIWMKNILGIPIRLSWIPYGNTFDQLEDVSSTINTNHQGINILFVRVIDLCANHPEDRREVLTKTRTVAQKPQTFSEIELRAGFDRLKSALLFSAGSCNAPLLIFCMPLPPIEYDLTSDDTHLWGRSEHDVKTVSNNIPQTSFESRIHLHHRLETEFITELSSFQCGNKLHIYPSQLLMKVLRNPEIAYDERLDTLMHAPFTQQAYCALAPLVCRQLARVNKKSIKLIVLDCDNTLWEGAVGELGPQGIQFTKPYKLLQQFFVQQQQQGVLLALCSRNIDQDVLDVFQTRSQDMPLSLDHIVGRKVNWKPKSTNIKALVNELSIALDSVVFVDDNPIEVSEVAANCPGVSSILLPKQPQLFTSFLKHCWAFDTPLRKGKSTTQEDNLRTELYRDTLTRNQLRHSYQSHSAFMASLNLWIKIEEMTLDTVERVAQLTDRTNQHNASKEPLTVAALLRMTGLASLVSSEGFVSSTSTLAPPTHQVFTVTTGDRFCTHGLVGVMIYRTAWNTGILSEKFQSNEIKNNQPPLCLFVEQFLLSCRTLHLGIEHAMLRFLAQKCLERLPVTATKNDLTQKVQLAFRWKPAPRNEPSRAFFFSIPNNVFVPSADEKRQDDQTANRSYQDLMSGNESNVVIPQQSHVIVKPDHIETLEWEAMSKNQKKKLIKSLVIKKHREKHMQIPGSKRSYKRQKRVQLEKFVKSKSKTTDSVVIPADIPSKALGGGISQYKNKPTKKQVPGVIYMTMVTAASVKLIQLQPPNNETTSEEQNDPLAEQKNKFPVYISPENGYILHSQTLTSVAMGLAKQDHSDPNDLKNDMTGFIEQELEKVIAQQKHLRESNPIYQQMDRLISLQKDEKENLLEALPMSDQETLYDYRQRLHARKTIRHEIRVALQKQNPDSHYKDVELFSEYS